MSSIVEEGLKSLLFGETWYIGILIFLILVLILMKLWKYSGFIILPIIFALEVGYYDRLNEYGQFIWAMLILLFSAILLVIYSFSSKGK